MENCDSDIENTPPEIREAAQATSSNLLPEKSKLRYEHSYDQFLEWRRRNGIKTSFSENVLLAYIGELSNKLSPPTLWTQYSMLRSTISTNHNVDISKYKKLRAFLKRKSDGYQPKKAKTLTGEQVNQFITTASDDKFLFEKVTLILGISGACRKQELVQLSTDDIQDVKSAAILYIRNTKNKTSRSFNITGQFYDIYKKYASLRPETGEKRFFLNYTNRKCTKQVVGINKIGSVPKKVAKFLNLANPELYTGHTFRRSSATILVDAGGDLETLKRHGGWKSSSVAEGYIDDSDKKRSIICHKIMEAVRSSTLSSSVPELRSPSPQILNEVANHQESQQFASNNTIVESNILQQSEQSVNKHIEVNQESPENNLYNAPVQFTHCSNNQFTFNFYNYPQKKN